MKEKEVSVQVLVTLDWLREESDTSVLVRGSVQVGRKCVEQEKEHTRLRVHDLRRRDLYQRIRLKSVVLWPMD
jgi:hypothetical protein